MEIEVDAPESDDIQLSGMIDFTHTACLEDRRGTPGGWAVRGGLDHG